MSARTRVSLRPRQTPQWFMRRTREAPLTEEAAVTLMQAVCTTLIAMPAAERPVYLHWQIEQERAQMDCARYLRHKPQDSLCSVDQQPWPCLDAREAMYGLLRAAKKWNVPIDQTEGEQS